MQRSTSSIALPVAVPQYISGRTSYLHVRLAFHSYPQVLPQFCNTGGCEPRWTVTSTSLCSWIAHVVSGRIAATFRLLQTRCPSGSPTLPSVNQATTMHSPDHSTKGTPSAPSRPRRQWPLAACEYVVSGSLSSPFRDAFHLSLTVLVRYRSLKVFSLGGWSPQLPTRLHVSRGTQDASHRVRTFDYGTLTPSGQPFQAVRLVRTRCPAGPTTPFALTSKRFGLLPFRSPLLWESRLISFRRATEMFQFAHSPSPGYGLTR